MSDERRPYLPPPGALPTPLIAPLPSPLRDLLSPPTSERAPASAPRSDIRAEKLGKRFDLYHHDRDRVLELITRQPRHASLWALQELSFEVPRGCAFGVIGSNGAGKSTLLKLLSGVSKPTEGILELNAQVSALLDLALGFHTGFTGRENIRLTCTLMGLERTQIDALEPQILAFAELGEFIDYPVKTWSSGMCLRLGFAIASHLHHQIFLIDEVLTVGDQYFQRKCVRKIEEFITQGRTIVLVSHDLHSIRSLCQRVLWLKEGRKVYEGSAAEVVDAYVDAARSREGQTRLVRQPMSSAFALGQEKKEGIAGSSADITSADSSSADSSSTQEVCNTTTAGDAPHEAGTQNHTKTPEETRASASGPSNPTSSSPTSSAPTQAAPDFDVSGNLPSRAYRATSADPTLRHHIEQHFQLEQAAPLWNPDEKTEALAEYHGETPLITGSGEARILEVTFLDGQGLPRDAFATGESVTIAVTVKALEPVEDPIFGVALHRNDDVYVYGPNTHFDKCLKGTYHGLYTFFLHYPSVPLLTGTYRVSVALWDKHHLKPHVWHNRLYTLTFQADRDDHGLLMMPHAWGVLTHASGAGEALVDPILPALSPKEVEPTTPAATAAHPPHVVGKT
ncbi:MAG: ABC transporter ATP-binding protein [Myxococcota bacterium]